MNGGELGVKLGRDVGLGDGGVLVRETVALEAKGADPYQRLVIDPREGVEHGGAGLTPQRRVGNRDELRLGTDQVDRGRDWDHALAGLNLCTRPRVPRHADAVDALRIRLRDLAGRH